jgi:hypothetical protein
MAISDHYFDQATLQRIGSDIKVGKPPKLDPISKEMLLKTIREGCLFNMTDFGTPERKSESTGLFGRLLGKRHKSQPPLQEKTTIDARGLKIAVIADRLHYPIQLIGQTKSVLLESGDAVSIFATLILLAKSAGWRGGNELVEIHKNHLVNRRLQTGMYVPADEAKEFVNTVESQYKGDPYAEEHVERILVLFRHGPVMIRGE